MKEIVLKVATMKHFQKEMKENGGIAMMPL